MKGIEWWDLAALLALCGFKMVPGVALCLAYRLDWWTQFFITGIGGSAGVVFFTFLGQAVGKLWRRFLSRRPTSCSPRKEGWKERLWQRYGLWGCAALTPPVLSPPVGTALALAFNTPKARIIAVHLMMVWLWSAAFTEFGHTIVGWLGTSNN